MARWSEENESNTKRGIPEWQQGVNRRVAPINAGKMTELNSKTDDDDNNNNNNNNNNILMDSNRITQRVTNVENDNLSVGTRWP